MSQAAAYASMLPMLSETARAHGYALAVHGSMLRDLDLLAAPWTDEAASPETLIEALHARVRWASEGAPHGPAVRPHGRLAWTIPLYGGPYLDVSVMPRRTS